MEPLINFKNPQKPGRQMAKYGGLGWDVPWHLEKSQAPEEDGKAQFPGARGPKAGGKSYHGCPQLFYILCFGQPDPQGRVIVKYGDFRPFWPRTAFGTWRNPGRGPKMERHNFPALGVPKSKTKATTLSGMVVRNFFMFYGLPDRIPTCGKSQNTGILA